MILISHRGNIDGKQPNLENAPYYINNTLKMGYNVEIDVWWYKDNFYLGHDEPMYKVEIKYLQDYRLWCHAKNIEAVIEFQKYPHIHYFWHQEDDICLTSKNYYTNENSIFYRRTIYRENSKKSSQHENRCSMDMCFRSVSLSY